MTEILRFYWKIRREVVNDETFEVESITAARGDFITVLEPNLRSNDPAFKVIVDQFKTDMTKNLDAVQDQLS